MNHSFVVAVSQEESESNTLSNSTRLWPFQYIIRRSSPSACDFPDATNAAWLNVTEVEYPAETGSDPVVTVICLMKS